MRPWRRRVVLPRIRPPRRWAGSAMLSTPRVGATARGCRRPRCLRFCSWLPRCCPAGSLTLARGQLLPLRCCGSSDSFARYPSGTWIRRLSSVAAVAPLHSLFLHDPAQRGRCGRVTGLYSAVAMAAVAYLLFRRGRRSVGVKASRILLASLGLGVCSARKRSCSVWRLVPSRWRVAFPSHRERSRASHSSAIYFAFATPRPLLSRWRRAEQAKYLETGQRARP